VNSQKARLSVLPIVRNRTTTHVIGFARGTSIVAQISKSALIAAIKALEPDNAEFTVR
jgi:hypothetical protein